MAARNDGGEDPPPRPLPPQPSTADLASVLLPAANEPITTRSAWAAHAVDALRSLGSSLADTAGPANAEQHALMRLLTRFGSATVLQEGRQKADAANACPDARIGDGQGIDAAARNGVLPPHRQNQRVKNLRTALLKLKQGAVTQTSRCLGSKGLADLRNNETREALLGKYPRRPSPVDTTVLGLGQGGAGADVQPFTADAALTWLTRRRRGTAGGPEGLSADDLKEVIHHDRKHRAPGCEGVEAQIAAIATAIAQGRFSDDAETADAITSAKGVALCKEAGSATAVRPISIEEILGRLAGALLATRHRDELLALCNGKQYCGKKGGTDELVNLLVVARRLNPGHALLSVDVRNAFNTINAQLLLDAAARVPGIAPYVELFFGQPQRRVMYGVSGRDKLDVRAEEGGAQGNPLTPPLYAAGQEAIVAPCMAPHDVDVLRAAYADNTYMHGDFPKAIAAYDAIVPALAAGGMHLGKKELLISRELSREEQDACDARGITVRHDGIMVVGVPVGTDEYVRTTASAKITEASEEAVRNALDMAREAKDGNSLQRILYWLRYNGAQKYVHLLRTVPPRLIQDAVARADTRLSAAVIALSLGTSTRPEELLEVHVHANTARVGALARVFTSVPKGGLGFMSGLVVSPAAFVGATATVIGGTARKLGLQPPEEGNNATHPLWAREYEIARQGLAKDLPAKRNYLEGVLALSSVMTRTGDALCLEDAHTKLSAAHQALYEKQVRAQVEEELMDRKGLESRAAWDAFVAAGGVSDDDGGGGSSIPGAWITAAPHVSGCGLSDAAFRFAVRSRLGLLAPGFTEASPPPTCACGKPADRTGSHAHVCTSNRGERTPQHHYIAHALKGVARAAGLHTRQEPWLAALYPRAAGSNAAQGGGDVDHPARGARDSEKTRGDLAIFHTNHGGQPLLVDVVLTCLTSGAKRAEPATQASILKQLADAEKTKWRRYAGWPVPDANLVPFAVSLGGAIGDEGLKLLGRLAEYNWDANAPLSYQSTQQLRKREAITRLSVALQQTNAANYYRWRATAMKRAPVDAEALSAAAG